VGRPVVIGVIEDMAIGAAGVDILRDEADALLTEPSYIAVFANREVVEILTQVKVGTEEVRALAGVPINTVVGDDPGLAALTCIYRGLGKAGERVQLNTNNSNAAAKEMRANVFIASLEDVAAIPNIIPQG